MKLSIFTTFKPNPTKPRNHWGAFGLLCWLVVSCGEQPSVIPAMNAETLPLCTANCPVLGSLGVVAAVAGRTVTMTGDNFSQIEVVQVNQQPVSFALLSETQAEFKLPEGETGIVTVNLVKRDLGRRMVRTPSLLLQRISADDPSVLASTPEEVCKGELFRAPDGTSQAGNLGCSPILDSNDMVVGQANDIDPSWYTETLTVRDTTGAIPICSAADQTGCLTVREFPATNLPTVGAALTTPIANCERDGQTDCLATSALPAFNAATVPATRLATTVALAGVQGTLPPCSKSGQIDCITTTDFQARAVGANNNTSLTTDNFNRSFTTQGSYTYWDRQGRPQTITVAQSLDAGDVRTAVNLFGVVGTLEPPAGLLPCDGTRTTGCLVEGAARTGPACATTGATDCIARNDGSSVLFGAGTIDNLSAENIRRAVSIATTTTPIVGTYPSATNPLEPYATDGPDATLVAGATDLPDLGDGGSFADKAKGSVETSYEYWEASGKRSVFQSDTDLQLASNYLDSISLLGTAGSMVSQCSSLDQSTCTADSACRWASGSCEFNTWHLRVNVNLDGQTGQVKTSCRNTIAAGFPGKDWFNTIDNRNANLSTLPPDIPVGSFSWSDENVCDYRLWTDVSKDFTSGEIDGSCDEAQDDCMMFDNVSGLTWSEESPVADSAPGTGGRNWQSALTLCNDLTFGNRSDWRFPTAREMLQAYMHGIRDLGYKSGTPRPGGDTRRNNEHFVANIDSAPGDDRFWSGSTVGTNTGSSNAMRLNNGRNSASGKNNPYRTICVAP